ncbi:MAG TPA: ATP-binding cassette domain-containing protein [Micropepsaceae bacterium]|nr:ATP-binding cassette domain-containing protein [Micropepsaceae bacterium]
MRAEPLLEASGIEAGYGRVQVLWGVDLMVLDRETVVLLGANGAGKTTLLKTLLGLVAAWRGTIRFAREDVTRLRTDHRVRRGIVYMSETAVFPGLTIEENIRIGGQFLPRNELRQRAQELYASFPALAERRSALASSLSGGQRKMLGTAKALAGNPRLLVMDEPSAGLSPLFVKEVLRILAQFRGQGLSLLIAEQNVKFLELADRVYTLDGGRIGFTGTVAAMHENDALKRAYFGLK